jgi:hypothetical protein
MLLVHDRRALGMATERNGAGSMANGSDVGVSAWVKIGDRATIDYHVCDEGEVEFSVGGRDGFVLATSELGLHNLVDRVQEALREVQSAVVRHDEGCPTV